MQLNAARYRTLIVTIAVGAFAVLALFCFWRCVNGPPCLLNIKRSKEGATVQFVKRDSRNGGRFISPGFQVPLSISTDLQIALASSDVVVPQGTVEFADTTLLPGRFRIRFGSVVLDVMESQIIKDGISHNWVLDDGGS